MEPSIERLKDGGKRLVAAGIFGLSCFVVGCGGLRSGNDMGPGQSWGVGLNIYEYEWTSDGADTPNYSKVCSIEIEMQPGASIRVWTLAKADRALFYQVRVGQEMQNSITYFATASIGATGRTVTAEDFRVISGKQGKLVGVAFASEPARIVIIHDFTAPESWPGGGSSDERRRRGQRLLETLRKENVSENLELGQQTL